MANEGGKIHKFGVSEKTWLAVTADDMRKRFPNNKNRYCSQEEWLEEYWTKLGLKTDKDRAWNIPAESDPMNWDLETWGSFVD
jgi:hypothetical protein